jgi:hypothetical protein
MTTSRTARSVCHASTSLPPLDRRGARCLFYRERWHRRNLNSQKCYVGLTRCGSSMLQRYAGGAPGRRIRRSGRGVTPRRTMRHESALSAKLKLAQPTSVQRTPSTHVTLSLIQSAALSCHSKRGPEKDEPLGRSPARFRLAAGVRRTLKKRLDEVRIFISSNSEAARP